MGRITSKTKSLIREGAAIRRLLVGGVGCENYGPVSLGGETPSGLPLREAGCSWVLLIKPT
jgi:hypothetical protein